VNKWKACPEPAKDWNNGRKGRKGRKGGKGEIKVEGKSTIKTGESQL